MLQLKSLSVDLGEESCIGLTQENSIENSVQDCLSYIHILLWDIWTLTIFILFF